MSTPESVQASTTQRTPFTLADAMILVAATAPGLALLVFGSRNNFFSMSIMVLATGGTLPPGYLFLERLTVSAWCLLPGWTLAVLLLTALRPKPARREAVGGPGFLACLAASLAMIASLAWFVIAEVISASHEKLVSKQFLFFDFAPFMTDQVLKFVAWTILGALIPLVFLGRWRPKPIWTDRLGCVIGACWVLIYGCNLIGS